MNRTIETADFCVEIDFGKGRESPSRVFKAMTNLIEQFESLDQDLVQSINGEIKPVLLLEDVESGSIKAWFKQFLESIDDDALKNMDWKPQVGKYLVKAKYIFVDFLGHHTTISDRSEITDLKQNLLGAAEETDVLHIPAYSPMTDARIAGALHELSEAVSPLRDGDSAKYVYEKSEASFNLDFSISPETIEELLTQETITSRSQMILQVKRPDFLGVSMWDFRHADRTIRAKIPDSDWLRRFQNRNELVRPGDAIRADVKIDALYDYDREVVAVHYLIEKVHEVIPAAHPSQDDLFHP